MVRNGKKTINNEDGDAAVKASLREGGGPRLAVEGACVTLNLD